MRFQWSKSWEQYNCWKPSISGYLTEKNDLMTKPNILCRLLNWLHNELC